MSEASDPCLCPQGHDDTVKLLSTVSVGGRASAAGTAPRGGGGGCCGGGCGCGWPGPSACFAADRYYAEITASTGALAGLIGGADLTLRVPTCPDWTLRQLATHVGRAQRWAAEIVSRRSPRPVAFRDIPDGRIPDDPAGHAGWLRAGADRLIAVLGQAGDVPVWAFGEQRPAGFWARRMTHETTVHGVDAQFAVAAGDGPPRGEERPHGQERRHRGGHRGRRDRRVAHGPGRHGPTGNLTCRPAGLAARRVAARARDGRARTARASGWSATTRTGSRCAGPTRRPPSRCAAARQACCWCWSGGSRRSDPAIRVHGDPALLHRWLAATRF